MSRPDPKIHMFITESQFKSNSVVFLFHSFMSPTVSREVSTEDEEELQDEDDSPEAFLDIEEDDILCQGYNPRPTVQVLYAYNDKRKPVTKRMSF